MVIYTESPQYGNKYCNIRFWMNKWPAPKETRKLWVFTLWQSNLAENHQLIGGVPTSSCIYRRFSIATLNYLEDVSLKWVKDNRIQHPQIDNPYGWFITAVLTLHAIDVIGGVIFTHVNPCFPPIPKLFFFFMAGLWLLKPVSSKYIYICINTGWLRTGLPVHGLS